MSWEAQKEFPENYSRRVVEILKAMSFTGKPKVIGSAALRSVQYIGDYDADDYNVKATPAKFKRIIRNLSQIHDVYIGDIKCGEMNGEPIRWTVPEILKGKLVMDDHYHTLADCIKNPGLFKLDIIAFIDSHYTEMSMIYLSSKSPRITTDELVKQLKNEVKEKYEAGMYYKMSKRMFSIARQEKDSKTAKLILPIFNGDLGRLYSIISDIDVLMYLFENKRHIPKDRLNTELDNIRTRMANIWDLKKFVKDEASIIKTIEKQLLKPKPAALYRLNEDLFKLLNYYAKEDLKKLGFFPPPANYLG